MLAILLNYNMQASEAVTNQGRWWFVGASEVAAPSANVIYKPTFRHRRR